MRVRPTSLCGQTFGLGRGHGRLPVGYLRPGKLGLRFARVLCSETGETPVPLIWQTSKSKGTLVLAGTMQKSLTTDGTDSRRFLGKINAECGSTNW